MQPMNLPRIAGSASWLACVVAQFVAGGDHTLLLGYVIDAANEPARPLTYHQRRFGTHHPVGMTE